MVDPLPDGFMRGILNLKDVVYYLAIDVLLPAARGEDAGGEAMAMRTASPWWASLVFGVGLLFVFLGERLFGHLPGVRGVLTGARRPAARRDHGLRAWTMMRRRTARAATSSARCCCASSACCSRSCSTR